jgi:hypothetical protein
VAKNSGLWIDIARDLVAAETHCAHAMSRANSLVERANEMADDIRDDREIAVGSHIESCYTAIEAAIERIVISTDGAAPAQGGRYHQDLIERAATENPGVRPAIISRPVANDLHDLRRFRHAKRRSYISYDYSRAQPNVAIAARAVPALRAEITAFAEQMKIKPIKRAKSVTTKPPRKSSRTPK